MRQRVWRFGLNCRSILAYSMLAYSMLACSKLSAQAQDISGVSREGRGGDRKATLAVQQAKELIEHIKQASSANAAQLKSAFGTGTIQQSIHEAGSTDPVILLDSDVQFFYDEPKFRIHLVHHERLREAIKDNGLPDEDFQRWVPSDISEQVILYDGEKVCSVEFRTESPCVGTIHFGFKKTGVLRAAGFPFESPVDLWSRVFNPQDVDLRTLSITPIAGGGFVGLIQKTTYQVKFVFLDKFGYDLRRVSSIRLGETQPFRDYLLTWDVSNGVYFVRRLTNTVTTAHGDTASRGQTLKRLTVEYDMFEANTTIGPEVFLLSSIDLPDGTRFLDNRANIEGGPKELVYCDSRLQPAPLDE